MTAWLSSEAEYEAVDGGEEYGGEEYGGEEYGEESRAERRRRARIALARRRQAEARARQAALLRPGPAPTPQQRTDAAVRTVELESRVAEDSLRSAVSGQNRRMSRSEYAAVAGVVVDQFMDSFDAPDNPFLRAGLRFAPTLILAPRRRGRGLESFITDPRVIGGVAIAGIAFFGDNRRKLARITRIEVQSPGTLTAGESDLFLADAFDHGGSRLDRAARWRSDDAAIATIDSVTGKVTAVGPGVAVITVDVDGVTRSLRLKVTGTTTSTAAARTK